MEPITYAETEYPELQRTGVYHPNPDAIIGNMLLIAFMVLLVVVLGVYHLVEWFKKKKK